MLSPRVHARHSRLKSFSENFRRFCSLGVFVIASLNCVSEAATYTVNSTADPGDGACDTTCTLRDAMDAANATVIDDTIVLAVTGTIYLDSGLFTDRPGLAGALTINGPGADLLTISGANLATPGSSALLYVGNLSVLSINDLTFADGTNNGRGGCISSQGFLTIRNSVIRGCWAGNTGGGIHNETGSGSGGGQLTLIDSTVSGNMTFNRGGGIFGGSSTLINSTVSGNSANGESPYGGGIAGTVFLYNSTVTDNSVNSTPGTIAAGGGGIAAGDDTGSTFVNSIIAGNSSENGPDILGSVISNGYNLIGDGSDSSGFDAIGDQVGSNGAPIDPMLGPLQNNGGTTETHAILDGSPAIDQGSNALVPSGVTSDQRGFGRVVDGDGDLAAIVDKGAYEFNASPESPSIIWPSSSASVNTNGSQLQYSGSPTGWNSNYAASARLSTFGVLDDYEIKFLIESNPASSLWMIGLGFASSSPGWQDILRAIRNANGRMMVYESGTWRVSGPTLSQGDIVSIYVNAGTIEYRHNGDVVYTSTYSGDPDYYVNATFKNGAATIDTTVQTGSVAPPPPPPPSGTDPITNWTNRVGAVTTNGSSISYSGTQTGWGNSVNSVPFSALGAGINYTVSWRVGSDPSTSIWVAGFGIEEIRSNWRDVDYAFRNSNGFLTIHESGDWIVDVGPLATNDQLAMRVSGGLLEFLVNGSVVHSRSILGTEDFYIDTSFKEGASELSTFRLGLGTAPPPPPPPGSTPITSWTNVSGGVSVNGNSLQYSGSPTGWVNSANSSSLSSLGAGSNYTVSWTVGSTPTNGIWVIGLGVSESGSNWRDIDYAFRNSNGWLTIHESGDWIVDVSQISVGDILSLRVDGTTLEFLVNGSIVHSRVIASQNFYIDTAFKNGAADLNSFILESDGSQPPPSGEIPVTSWFGEVGGVSTVGDIVSYTGSPTGWVNSVNSTTLASLGAGNEYSISWTINSDPSNGLWVAGLGIEETGSSWRDVDFAFRNTNGILTIYIEGSYVTTVGSVVVGDILRLEIDDLGVRFRFRGGVPATVSRPNLDKEKLYIDTAFKNGAATLGSFLIENQ